MADKPSPSTNGRKPRRWLFRLTVALLTLLVLILGLRLALAKSMPWLLNHTLEQVGLQGTYEKLHLSLLTGELELWHLRLSDTDPNQPLVHLEYCRADISTRSLLHKRLIIPRLDVDGLFVDVQRDSTGQWRGWSGLLTRGQQPPQAPSSSSTPSTTAPVNLTPPLQVDAVRLQHIRMHVQDPTQDPPIDIELQMHLRVSDLGSTRRPLQYTLGLSARPGLDLCVIEGEGTTAADRLQTRFEATLRGFRSQTLRPYLEAAGLDSASDSIQANLKGHLWLSLQESDPNRPPSLHTGMQVDQLLLVADQQLGLKLQGLNVTLKQPQPQQFVLEQAVLKAGEIHLERDALGTLRFLGLAPMASSSPPSPSAPTSSPLTWAVETVTCENLNLLFHDRLCVTDTPLQVTIQQLQVEPNQADPTLPSTFKAQLTAPGLMRRMQTQGQVRLHSDHLMAQCLTQTQGLTLARLRPYLVAAGWEPALKDGQFSAQLKVQKEDQAEAGQRLDLALTNVSLTDDTELYHLDRLALIGLQLDPHHHRIALEKLERTGERLTVTRESEGLNLLGLRYHPDLKTLDPNAWLAAAQAPPSPSIESPSQTSSGTGLQRIEIGSIVAQDQKITFLDPTTDSNHPQTITGDISFSLDSLVVDFNNTVPRIRPGRCQGSLAIPGLIETLTLTGTLGMKQRKLDLDLAIAGKGLQGEALGHYSALLGILPTFSQGDITGQLQGQLWPEDQGLALDLQMQDFNWADIDQTLLGLHYARVQGLKVGPQGLSVQALDIDQPVLRLGRDPNGLLVLAGMGRQANDSPTPRPTSSSQGQAGQLHIDKLQVRNGRLLWQDQSMDPVIDLQGNLNITAENLALEPNASPSHFDLTLSAPQVMDSMTLQGSTQLSPERQHVSVTLAIEGLRSDPLLAYFPAHSHPVFSQGQIQASVQASIQQATDGSQQIQAALTDVRIEDVNQTWLTIPEAQVKISQFDPEQLQVTVDQIRLAGVTAQLQQRPEAQLAVLGWHLNPAPPVITPESDPNVTETVTSQVSTPRPVNSATEAPQSPCLRLKELDLGIDRVTWQDLTTAAAEPLVLQDVHLVNDGVVLFSNDLADVNNPISLTLTGKLTPIVETFEVQAQCRPFADQQQADLTITLEGIEGEGLNRVLPGISESLDGRSLQQGRFFVQASLTTALSRREFLDFDLARPFALNLETTGLCLTEAQNEVPLLGFNEFHLEAPQIDLVQNRYRISRLEWTGPQARLRKTQEGLEVAGLTLKTPAPAETPPVADVNQPAVVTNHDDSELPDVAIKQILVSGLDLRYVDETVEPAVQLPLNNFDFEWQGLSTRALSESVPMRFNALLSADMIPIVVDRVPSLEDPNIMVPVIENHPLLQEVTATGYLTLGDRPQGWIKAGINSLDLRAFRGLAQESGVSIASGVLDASLDMRLRTDGKAPTSLGLVITDLSLADSPDAVLTQRLALPAPLDAVLFAVKDLDGALRLKPHFELDINHGLTKKQIIGAIFDAVGILIRNAFATSALKPATAMAGMLGMGQEDELPFEPVTVTYQPGTLVLNPQERAALQGILTQLQQDKQLSVTIRHHLGAADLVYAQRLANPSLPDRKRLIRELQQQRQDLLNKREQLLAQAEIAYGLDHPQQIQTLTEQLITLHSRLGLLEQSLDNLLETLRPGSEMAEKRRTRQGAIALGQGRLGHLEQWLAQAGIPIAGQRKRVNTVPARFEKDPQAELGTVTFTLLRQTQ